MKAVLVGIHLPGVEEKEFLSSLAELHRLVETLGFEVVGKVTQRRRSPSPATAIGEGKLQELALWTGGAGVVPSHQAKVSKATARQMEAEEPEESETDSLTEEANEDLNEPDSEFLTGDTTAPGIVADKVIFDQELTPNQLANLQQATGAEVLDRTGVIIEIFHRHAKTQEAKLQVEIARLRYLSPRLRATGPSERQGGGIGSKGVGETSHELNRRRIRDRIAELQTELDGLHSSHKNRRQRRRDLCRVALVGYTNAGKSSLMRALTGSAVLVENKLFATLDTTVRTLQPEMFPKVLVSDTVGFIQKLPHDLVASFRSTLDEAGEASLILYVVDASDPDFRSHLKVTHTVMAEIESADIPSLLILNKSDLVDPVSMKLLRREFPESLVVSAHNLDDVARLKRVLREQISRNMESLSVFVRYDDKSGLIGEIRRNTAVIDEKHDELGVRFLVRSYPEVIERLKKRIDP